MLVMASLTDTKLYRNASGNKEDTALMNSYIQRTGMSTTATKMFQIRQQLNV